jgi:hypothetical protein
MEHTPELFKMGSLVEKVSLHGKIIRCIKVLFVRENWMEMEG